MRICHMTSVHSRDDIRIFRKMCVSLAKCHEVFLVVSDGEGDDVVDGVHILDAGAYSGRFSRMVKSRKRILEKALSTKSDIFHFHDPELIPLGLKLKKLGFKVVQDSHEDFPKQLLTKPYLNRYLAKALSIFFSSYESYASKKMDAVVAATPAIRDKFLGMGCNSVDINNYPLLGELSFESGQSSTADVNPVPTFCYVGGVSEIRGISQLVKALELLSGQVQLVIAGQFNDKKLFERTKLLPGWKYVNHLGWVSREKLPKVMAGSIGGIVTFLPVPNHIDSQPNKMFEYMSAGLPIVASHFDLWKSIVDNNKCGVCVDPESPQSIAEGLLYLKSNKHQAIEMGRNGRLSVTQRYNWDVEKVKLFEVYKKIMGN